jgi:predicted ATP-dependent protease
MSRTLPISARIPQEDADFLAKLKIEGAITPSDKLRAIIGEARQRAEGQGDYAASLQWIRQILVPAVNRIREGEHRTRMHSELVLAVAEWLPQACALILSEHADGANEKQQLIELEKALADRAFQLAEALLRLGVTEQAPCYDKNIISSKLGPVLDLTQVVLSMRERAEGVK